MYKIISKAIIELQGAAILAMEDQRQKIFEAQKEEALKMGFKVFMPRESFGIAYEMNLSVNSETDGVYFVHVVFIDNGIYRFPTVYFYNEKDERTFAVKKKKYPDIDKVGYYSPWNFLVEGLNYL